MCYDRAAPAKSRHSSTTAMRRMRAQGDARRTAVRSRAPCAAKGLSFFRPIYRVHGRALGIATATSTSRSIPPAANPSRTQSRACHQSSYAQRAQSICSGGGLQVTGQASTSRVRHLPREGIRSVPTTTVIDRSPCWLRRVSTGTHCGPAPGIQSGVGPVRVGSELRIAMRLPQLAGPRRPAPRSACRAG